MEQRYSCLNKVWQLAHRIQMGTKRVARFVLERSIDDLSFSSVAAVEQLCIGRGSI